MTITNDLAVLAGGAGGVNTGGFMRNRIINGAMVIDQRNAGASGTAQAYTVDRWGYYAAQVSKGTWGQNLGSVTPPNGFANYLGFSSSSAYSVVSGDSFIFNQMVEGFNIADFGWGSANAVPVTFSFWVRSSLTGTHSGALRNGTVTRSYVFTFTVNAANTWEYKTVTILGDTTGTWATNNTLGVAVSFSLGNGSTYNTSSTNAWVSGHYIGATGSVSVVGTNGATFYVTGVQLEVGTVATPFEREIYSQTLAKCQRYFETSYTGVAVGTALGSPATAIYWWAQNAGNYNCQYAFFKVTKRSAPTTNIYNAITGTAGQIRSTDYSTNLSAVVNSSSVTGFMGGVNNVAVPYSAGLAFHYAADSEL
jgi:hypothetical protein